MAEIFFPVLALAAIDWTMVEVFWSDERAVRPDDQDSNYRVADELLLRRVAIDRARIHRMEADAADLYAAARQYQTDLGRPSARLPDSMWCCSASAQTVTCARSFRGIGRWRRKRGTSWR